MLQVQSFYLPWVYMLMEMVSGGSPFPHLLGILTGHLYYFITSVYFRQAVHLTIVWRAAGALGCQRRVPFKLAQAIRQGAPADARVCTPISCPARMELKSSRPAGINRPGLHGQGVPAELSSALRLCTVGCPTAGARGIVGGARHIRAVEQGAPRIDATPDFIKLHDIVRYFSYFYYH